jgi:hypothetical protein
MAIILSVGGGVHLRQLPHPASVDRPGLIRLHLQVVLARRRVRWLIPLALASAMTSCWRTGPSRSASCRNSLASRFALLLWPSAAAMASLSRRKIAKKIAKNKRCYANTLRPRSRMLLKVSGLLRVQPLGEIN